VPPRERGLSVGTTIWGDGGYRGQTDKIHEAAPEAQDMTNRRAKTKDGVDEQQRRKNRTKSRVRAKVEWPFRNLKRVFKYAKVCYRGLKKNRELPLTAFALVNLYQHRRRLAPQGAYCLPRLGYGLRRRQTRSHTPLLPANLPSSEDSSPGKRTHLFIAEIRELIQRFPKRPLAESR